MTPQPRTKKLKPYPGSVCWNCANPLRKVKSVGAHTCYMGVCGVCGAAPVSVSTPGDYGWPDFPGFVKVKRAYVWD